MDCLRYGSLLCCLQGQFNKWIEKFCWNEHIDVRKCVRYNKEKEMIA